MKKLIMSLALCLIAIAVQADERLMITTGDFPPWTGKSIPHDGFANHVIRSAFAHVGYEVVFVYMPWKRAYEEARSVQRGFDASSFWMCSEERQEYFYCSDRITNDDYAFFHLKTRPFDWNTLDDLKGMTIGATIGYSYTKEFWEKGRQGVYTIEEVHDDVLNFKKLIKERIDIFPISIVVGNTLLDRNFDPSVAATVTFHPKILSRIGGFLLFPKAGQHSKQHLDDFNRGLRDLKASGVYDKLYDGLLEGTYRKM